LIKIALINLIKLIQFSELLALTANCVRNSKIRINQNQTLKADFIKKLRIGFSKEGDILLTHKGTIGETAIVPKGTKLILLSPKSPIIV
jgi:type I restriction enzyme S subunit